MYEVSLENSKEKVFLLHNESHTCFIYNQDSYFFPFRKIWGLSVETIFGEIWSGIIHC